MITSCIYYLSNVNNQITTKPHLFNFNLLCDIIITGVTVAIMSRLTVTP